MRPGQSYGPNSFEAVGSVGRPLIDVVAAAATVALTSKVMRLTGTVPVATLTPPDAWFNGPVYLLSTDATPFTTITTGNIQLATTMVRYKLLTLMYDPATSKWYPSY